MIELAFEGVLTSLKAAKDAKSNNYADFIFMGGSVSLPVDAAMFERLKEFEGKQIQCLLECRPRTVVLFDRPVTLFDPVRVLNVK